MITSKLMKQAVAAVGIDQYAAESDDVILSTVIVRVATVGLRTLATGDTGCAVATVVVATTVAVVAVTIAIPTYVDAQGAIGMGLGAEGSGTLRTTDTDIPMSHVGYIAAVGDSVLEDVSSSTRSIE